jgi:putative membrane protein
MGWFGHNMGSWGWSGMVLAMIVFWGLLITGIVLLIRILGQRRPGSTNKTVPETAERLLAERFARSEIDETEYRARLAALHDAMRS